MERGSRKGRERPVLPVQRKDGKGRRMRLKGKVALITGGGTGIGLAITEQFVAEGAKVIIAGRRKGLLEKAATLLPAGMIEICSGDVSKGEDVERMVAAALVFGGSLDVLVNNAGINPKGSILGLDPAVWRHVLDVNITGPFLLMKASIPHMIERGGGSIINVSSLGGIRCLPDMPAYNTSKAALIMLTQQAALDYGPYKVRCNAVCPGAVRTPMLEGALHRVGETLGVDDEGMFGLAASDVPLRRVADPSEIAGICTYLASDEASFMTGAVLVVDGGASIVDAGRVAVARAVRDRASGERKSDE
jgi:meso-butanediol dehydrogenase/(S,S)-butanediol dehydrogenase/diacetyl reductase